jgi:hypothetical protein
MSFTGVGTILRRGAGTNPIPLPGADTFSVIGRVQSINGPNAQKQEVEDNTLDTTGGYTQTLSGLRDGGEVELALSFEPGTAASPANGHQDLIADFNANTANARRNWQIEWPDGTIADFQGEVFASGNNTEAQSPVSLNVTVRVNGQVTYTFP